MNIKKEDVLFDIEQFSERFVALWKDLEDKEESDTDIPGNVLSIKIKEKTHFSISEGQISNYKNAKSAPSVENLICLAKFFDVSPDYLLGLTESTSQEAVDQEMSKKYRLSDKAMENLAKWKKDSMSAFPFAASKIIDEIIKNEAFVSKIEIALNNIMKLRNNHLHEQMSEAEYEEKIAVNKYLASRAFEVLFDELYSALEKKWETQMKKFSKDSEPLF